MPGAPVRIAAIDSGVNPRHSHVKPIAGGIQITTAGLSDDFIDVLGHGTAVIGAIREKVPEAEIFAVKVFHHSLVTSGSIMLAAIDWCLEARMDFINLSLGTLNTKYALPFRERVARARESGITIVAAFEMNAVPALPGSLPDVVGVVLDPDCPRNEYRSEERNGRILLAASGYPRPIPGIPERQNLQGISFAVANVTGLLAAERVRC